MIAKEQLEELYIKQNKTRREIAKELNVSINRVGFYLEKYHISRKKLFTVYISYEELYDLYITQNLCIVEIGKMFNITPSAIYHKLLKYNIKKPKYLQTKHRKQAFKKLSKDVWNKRYEKTKKTCMEKYGVENPSKVEYIQNKKNSKESIEKARKTRIKNKTFNKSTFEKQVKQLLLQKFPDLKCQYKSESYQFSCDFYIPKLDLYIEVQGHWSHGLGKYRCPYDNMNQEHLTFINECKCKNTKFYNKFIEVWTIRDPLKRETARKNNLNWIEFFNMIEFMNWFEKQ